MVIHRIQRNEMIAIALLAVALGGGSSRAQARSTDFEQTVKGIENHEITSIDKAGDSGDPAYIPYLRRVFSKTVGKNAHVWPWEEAATLALVKLGDKAEARKLECALLTNDPGTVDHIANSVLPKIKGWFAIRAYYYLLLHNEDYIEKLRQPEYQTDVAYLMSPNAWATYYLPRVTPHSPFPASSGDGDPRILQLARQWKLWIPKNRLRLEKLQPSFHNGLTISGSGCAADEQ